MVTLAHHSNFTAGDLERFMGLSVGFDSMFNRLMNFPTQQDTGYPPYNIRKVELLEEHSLKHGLFLMTWLSKVQSLLMVY